MNLQGLKVVSAAEMQKIEQEAIQEGASRLTFMQKAGVEIARRLILDPHFTKQVVLFSGKGNNGGDGYQTLIALKQKGCKTRAFELFKQEEMSELAQESMQSYLKNGGAVQFVQKPEEIKLSKDEIILDGIFGTGLKSELSDFIIAVIEKINQTKNYRVAIDIPSGLNGDSGLILPVAIKAHKTIYLGLPKKGFFVENGWNYVGLLEGVDFGLEKKWIEKATAEYFLLNEKATLSLLPEIKRTQHKYEAGYVVGIAGSPSMEGAANLSALAALHSGAGIVRLFLSGKKVDYRVLADEIIKEHLTQENLKEVLKIASQAASLFVGPGLGRTSEVFELLKILLPQLTKPTVLDADALFFLAENPDTILPKELVLTPHLGEMLRLLRSTKLGQLILFEKTQDFVNKKNLVLVLKGAPTFIFLKDQKPLIVPRGDPGMATAGSGDVLTGIIAAFLAKKLSPVQGAVLGVLLHALAGEIAAEKRSSYSVTASDLIEALSEVFKRVLKSV